MYTSESDADGADERSRFSPSAVTLLTAGAIGFAIGAVIWQYRRTHPEKFSSFDRAVDLAREGGADTMRKLRRRLKEEGYSRSEIEGRAKKYLSQLIDVANRRI